jgi:hypothetical protein
MDGSKILSMVVENFHFRDSLNYLPMSLKSMPKSFDLTCRKGYYSHFLNTASNVNYVGPYLDPEFYGADFMSADERAQFLEWHQEQACKKFSNKEELLAYCVDDVNVLRQACCAFRNLFLKLVKIDPLGKLLQYRVPDHILKIGHGIIPRAGYRMGDRQSIEALQWLAYIGRTKNIHAGNGREVHLAGVPNVKVDGYCEHTNEV